MQTATAYYDGSQIVVDDSIKKSWTSGQEIMLVFNPQTKKKSKKERFLEALQTGELTTKTDIADDAVGYVRELRNDDRI